jgi:sulfatase modifying factor 1
VSCQPTGPSAGQCGSNVIVTATLPTYSADQDFDAGPVASDASVVAVVDAGEKDNNASSPSGDSGHDATVVASDSGDERSIAAAPDSATTPVGPDSGDATSPADATPTQDSGPMGAGDAGTTCASTICQQTGVICQDDRTLATCAKDVVGCLHVASTSGCSTSTTCVGGVCGGVCGPTQTRCNSNTPQTCASGAWVNGSACSSNAAYCAAGACSAPPSCQAGGDGLTNCGTSSESCCTSLEVPGGTFDRTYTNTGSGPTGEADPATVSGYRLDKYDVTVGRFRQFVTAWNGGSGWTPPAGSGKHAHLNGGQGLANSGSAGTSEPGWLVTDNGNIAPTASNLSDAVCDPSSAHAYATWTATVGGDEKLPINCVNWFEAYAFCIWDGGFLPSKAEWEYAAAGGNQQRQYPWGSTAPGTANQYAIYGCNYPSGSGTCTGVASIAPVGTATLGAGLWGQLDLGGNVWQWNLDWDATYVDPCTDCADLTAASYREVQGGIFSGTTDGLMPQNRYDGVPANRLNNIGFRCARSP